jgi:Ca-activated chloride channel homolog
MRTIIVILFCALASPLLSQQTTRILFVFDASNSMSGYWEKERKITTATRLLSEAVDKLGDEENVELGLRVYGHQTRYVPGKQDCEDTELVVPIGSGRDLIIKKELSRLNPMGTTPIARSLELAANDFDDCRDCRNIIILITDGLEACDGDPCAVSRALQAKGIILKPFIIGIGIEDQFKMNLECVGNFFDATKEETFKQVLDIVITQALNSTTAQINLLNSTGQPLETNVPITIYNSDTKKALHNFVHTLNHAGNPDTITLDPVLTYDIFAHTLPPVRKDGFAIVPGEHNILALNTPQGDLNLVYAGGRTEYADLKCLVRKGDESCEEVNVQDYGTMERYLVGTYDLKVLTLPPLIIENVDVDQSHTTEVQIPLPGILLLQAGTAGFGGLFQVGAGQMEMVKKFSYGDASGRYVMQPGKYKIVFRSKNSKQMVYTIEKEFTIASGKNTSLTL